MTLVETRPTGTSEPAVLAPGEEIAPGYRVVELISRGAALDVYEVYSDERLCSCIAKAVRPDRRDVTRVRDRLLLEGKLLETLAHPHLPRAFETVHEPHPVVVIETIVGLTLEEVIVERSRRLPSTDLAHLGRQLSSATQYLHAAGYLHLDIRPSNVMAANGIATLIDLSIARPSGVVPRGTGTREYMSPEQARGDEVTPASDAWGIGATLYHAATGVAPFAPHDDAERAAFADRALLQLARPAPPLIRWGRRLHPVLADVIGQCLRADPAERPAIREIHDRLRAVVDA